MPSYISHLLSLVSTKCPVPSILAYFSDIHFHRDKAYAAPVGVDEQEQLLSDYFYEHDAINSKALASLLNCSLTTSRSRLKVLVARGRLAPIPLTRIWYRPTPGNFGH
jgi:hypothetical protein